MFKFTAKGLLGLGPVPSARARYLPLLITVLQPEEVHAVLSQSWLLPGCV